MPDADEPREGNATVVADGRRSLLGCAGTLAVLLAACTGQGPASPTPAVPSTAAAATLVPTEVPTILPLVTPTPAPTFPPDLDPSQMPAGFIEGFNKLEQAVGGHGGSPAADLPASVAIDYWVSGTCAFDISIVAATGTDSTPVTSFSIHVPGSTLSGTWLASLKAGSYYVTPGEADGCRFSITVRAAS